MQIRIKKLSTLASACTGGLLTLLFVGLLIIPSTQSIRTDFIDSYGKALASMGAKQAVDAAFNHDLVRLQVSLQDIMENPYTLLATIHDVENKLLVQAGDANAANSSSSVVYSSPILLHDSIAGYVNVTIDSHYWSLTITKTIIYIAIITLLGLIVWELFRTGAIEIIYPEKPKNTKRPEIKRQENNGETEDDTENQEEENAENNEEEVSEDTIALPPVEAPVFIYAVIHIKNHDTLKEQLNGKNFRDTMLRLRKIVLDVMALYGGHAYELKNNYYVLTFKSTDSKSEAMFRAVCSAYLITELASIIDKIPLNLAGMVTLEQSDITPQKLPQAGLIIESSATDDTLLNNRIECVEHISRDGRKILAAFKPPYHNLIQGQTKQLLRVSNIL